MNNKQARRKQIKPKETDKTYNRNKKANCVPTLMKIDLTELLCFLRVGNSSSLLSAVWMM